MSDTSTSWASDLHERLKDREYAVGFLKTNLEEYERDGDLGAFLVAIRHVAQAQGKVKKLAEEMGVDRSTVYRALSKEGNPTITSCDFILNRGIGFTLPEKGKR